MLHRLHSTCCAAEAPATPWEPYRRHSEIKDSYADPNT